MPGISHFSKEQIAEKFAETIRTQDQVIFDLRSSLRQIVELESRMKGDDYRIAFNAVIIAKHALKESESQSPHS